jgi:3-deoxy-manno-octulosonate cytidylyltransferase (CMP-KDO synthetase)
MFKILIPARLNSQRLERKLLKKVDYKTIIQMTWEACNKTGANEVTVVTDSDEIFELISNLGGNAYKSKKEHNSGTDRIQEYIEELALSDDELVINVQGDEPLIEVEAVNQLGSFMLDNQFQYGTIAKNFSDDNYLMDANKVKVLVDGNKGLDFYRTNPNSSHANCKVLHHIGIYAFTAGFLNLFAKTPPTVNEKKLKLEQLRAIENGFPINVLELELKNSWGIDTEEDLNKLRDYLKSN